MTFRLLLLVLLSTAVLPCQVVPSYIVSTVAGADRIRDGGPATDALLDRALSVAFDPAGNLLILDGLSRRLRSVGLDGRIQTVVNVTGYCMTVDSSGNVYVGGESVAWLVSPSGQS